MQCASKTEIIHFSWRFLPDEPTSSIKVGDQYVQPIRVVKDFGLAYA